MTFKELHQSISLALITKIQKRGVNTPFVLSTPALIQRRIEHLIEQARLELREHGVSSSFRHVHPIKTNYHREIIEAAMKAGSWIEVGSEFELLLMEKALRSSKIQSLLDENFKIFCNGLKTSTYLDLIHELWHQEITIVPVLDNVIDARKMLESLPRDMPLGVRLRVPGSRFGLSQDAILDLCQSGKLQSSRLRLIQIHASFHQVLTREKEQIIRVMTELSSDVGFESVEWFDVGGGIPQGISEHQDSRCLHDYLSRLARFLLELQEQGVIFPTVVSEAGRWVVSASENLIFQVLGKERMPDKECWYYHVDGSFITDLLDSFLLGHQWQVMAVTSKDTTSSSSSLRDKAYLAGSTLDEKDVYPIPETREPLFLPSFQEDPYFLVFRNVGAYQENLRGLHNFQVPRPRVILLDQEDGDGEEFIVRQTAFVDDILARFGW